MSRDAAARGLGMPPGPFVGDPVNSEETLVADARSGLTPAQMIDRRLGSLLQGTGLPRGPGETFGPPRTL